MPTIEEQLNKEGVSAENTVISLKSNWLVVNGQNLHADTYSEKLSISDENLSRILILGRRVILDGIESQFVGDVRPSIWTAQFGTAATSEGKGNKVFTEAGNNNGGVITEQHELNDRYHPYWDAVLGAGFLPEVRRTSGKEKGGAWLLLRKPTLLEVGKKWLGWSETIAGTEIRQNATIRQKEGILSDPERRDALRVYRTVGEASIDRLPDYAGMYIRSRQQIGLLLGAAAMRYDLRDTDGYSYEIDDALEYADNDPSIDDGTIRAIENSTYNT
jgi:hypothetical protein